MSSDDSSTFPPTAWRSYVQKAAAGQCESCSLSMPWLFPAKVYRGVYITQYSSIPISFSHLPSQTETTEWQGEVNGRMLVRTEFFVQMSGLSEILRCMEMKGNVTIRESLSAGQRLNSYT